MPNVSTYVFHFGESVEFFKSFILFWVTIPIQVQLPETFADDFFRPRDFISVMILLEYLKRGTIKWLSASVDQI